MNTAIDKTYNKLENLSAYIENRKAEYRHDVSMYDVVTLINKIEKCIKSMYVPLPRDVNGKPINIGDIVAWKDDEPLKVDSITMYDDGYYVLHDADGDSADTIDECHRVDPDNERRKLENEIMTALSDSNRKASYDMVSSWIDRAFQINEDENIMKEMIDG